MRIDAVIVAVDYLDLLKETLPWNLHHFYRVMVITTPRDEQTFRYLQNLNRDEPKVCMVVTDLFYANGAHFNKWAALEEGMTIGRKFGWFDDWICYLDADVMWPKFVPGLSSLSPIPTTHQDYRFTYTPGKLYTPRRRMMVDVDMDRAKDQGLWATYPLHRQEREFAGYTQLFHSTDPVLGTPPWHQTNWTHAGGADSFFQMKWREEDKIRPPWEVLHLGPAGMNWCGRATELLDGSRPDGWEGRLSTLVDMVGKRAGKDGEERFKAEKIG